MYRQYFIEGKLFKRGVLRVLDGDCIPFDPANTDYQRFKTEIEAGEAALENAEGALMTSDEAKAFVATLP